MDRKQKLRIFANVCFVIVAASALVWTIVSIRKTNLLYGASAVLTSIQVSHSKLSTELDQPLRRGTVVTPELAVIAFKNHLSLLNSFKIPPESMPEGWAVPFQEYLDACKQLSSTLEEHASDPTIASRCPDIAHFMVSRNGPPPKTIPEPFLTRLQAVQVADGRLQALAQRDGLRH